MRENGFREEELLAAYLSEATPPEDVADGVTPWRRAMRLTLVGLALQMVTLNFLYLNYILPVVGMVCLILGMRALGGENGGFSVCRAATYTLAVLSLPEYALMATVYYGTIRASAWYIALLAVRAGLRLVILLALRAGLRQVGERAGVPVRLGGATALVVWDVTVLVMAYLRVGNVGLLGAILFLGSYIAIFVSLRGVYHSLDAAGYVLTGHVRRVPDGMLAGGILAVLAASVAVAYALANQLPMDFAPTAGEREASAEEIAQIEENLLSLGFPGEVLQDFAPEEILACAGARRVMVKVSTHAMNDGREVTTVEERDGVKTYVIRRVYDAEELTLTGIAVELPPKERDDSGEERARWRIIHHFRWTKEPSWRGTEALRLWNTVGEWWQIDGEITGRVLTTRDGEDYAAPYRELGRKTYRTSSIFWGESEQTSTVASFSFPADGEQSRGYVAYTVKMMRRGSIFDFWIDYLAPRSPIIYPATTAAEFATSSSMTTHTSPYRLAQDAIQFYPWG